MDFEELVSAGRAAGLNAPEAEARARDVLYGEDANDRRSFLNDVDEAWQLAHAPT